MSWLDACHRAHHVAHSWPTKKLCAAMDPRCTSDVPGTDLPWTSAPMRLRWSRMHRAIVGGLIGQYKGPAKKPSSEPMTEFGPPPRSCIRAQLEPPFSQQALQHVRE